MWPLCVKITSTSQLTQLCFEPAAASCNGRSTTANSKKPSYTLDRFIMRTWGLISSLLCTWETALFKGTDWSLSWYWLLCSGSKDSWKRGEEGKMPRHTGIAKKTMSLIFGQWSISQLIKVWREKQVLYLRKQWPKILKDYLKDDYGWHIWSIGCAVCQAARWK